MIEPELRPFSHTYRRTWMQIIFPIYNIYHKHRNIYKVFQLGEIIGYDLKSIGNIGQLCLIVQPTDVIGGHVRSLHINNLLSFNLGKELMFLTVKHVRTIIHLWYGISKHKLQGDQNNRE